MRFHNSILYVLAATLLAVTAEADDVNCGDTISGAVTVTGGTVTSGACPGDPVLHLTGRALLDLNGHTISCSLASASGVLLTGGRNVLRNGTIDGCQNGVQLSGDGGNVLSDILVRNNSLYGIRSSPGVGANTLIRVYAEDNGSRGIWLRGDGNRILDSRTAGNPDGFSIIGDSNVIVRSIASRGVASSIAGNIVMIGDRNVLLNSIAANADQYGIYFSGDAGTLRGNHATGSGEAGFSIQGTNHTLLSNVATSNGGSGFLLDSADGVRFVRNVAIANGASGAEVHRTSAGTGDVIRNVAVANGTDGFVSSSGSGRLIGNVAVDNTGSGLVRADGSDQLVAANTLSLNEEDGTVALSGSGDGVRSNRLVGNGDAGIRLTSSVADADLRGNSAFGNNGNGGAFQDLRDENAACGSNTWQRNHLGTVEHPDSGVTTNSACVE